MKQPRKGFVAEGGISRLRAPKHGGYHFWSARVRGGDGHTIDWGEAT
jgi:hypothetical protein